MIFDNYFQVPDGALCRPIENEKRFFIYKERWRDTLIDAHRPSIILGKWETQEKTITITEREFDEAIERARIYKGFPFSSAIKEELFK